FLTLARLLQGFQFSLYLSVSLVSCGVNELAMRTSDGECTDGGSLAPRASVRVFHGERRRALCDFRSRRVGDGRDHRFIGWPHRAPARNGNGVERHVRSHQRFLIRYFWTLWGSRARRIPVDSAGADHAGLCPV